MKKVIAISIALLAIVSSVLFVNRRKATVAKSEGVEPETKPSEVIGETRRTPESGDSQLSNARDTASSAPELEQSSMPDANIARSRDESGVSKSKAGSDAGEEYVTLPI